MAFITLLDDNILVLMSLIAFLLFRGMSVLRAHLISAKYSF
jgi:hypothetical protein